MSTEKVDELKEYGREIAKGFVEEIEAQRKEMSDESMATQQSLMEGPSGSHSYSRHLDVQCVI